MPRKNPRNYKKEKSMYFQPVLIFVKLVLNCGIHLTAHVLIAMQ